MEKRLALAFALSFLVLLLWSYFTGTRQEQTPTADNGATRQTPSAVSESGTSGERGLGIPEAPAAVPGAEEKEIKVDTPLYEAVFSNRGATIKSFKLKKYKTELDADSPPVDLVTISDDGVNFLSVNFNAGQGLTDDKAIIYSASRNSVALAEGSQPVDLTFTCPSADGVAIEQTFRFYPDKYIIDLFVTVTNNTDVPLRGSVRASLRNMPPESQRGYTSFTGAVLLLNDKLEQIKYSKMKKEGRSLSGRIGWVAYESGYFMSSIIPEEEGSGGFYGLTTDSGVVSATYISTEETLNPSNSRVAGFKVYFGPKDQDILKSAGSRLEKAIYFGFFNIIAKPLHFLLRLFYKYVHNYGISIIVLTILIRILFWPLTHKSYTSMKEMQKIQPLMARIREKYKDDREQMQREMMALYKTYKVNPMGGCLPMLIQIPVFFALYRILGSSIELRHAPFMLWITDLSAPDRLFNFPFNVPFMVEPDGIPVLTLLMGASMFLQQKMSPPPGDPAQAKMMLFLPIIFTLMFINFQSGLVLYWLVNNLIGIAQQYRIKRSSV